MAEYNKQPRRKFCQFCKDGTDYIDYKDTAMLRKFVTDRGKIKPRRVTGATSLPPSRTRVKWASCPMSWLPSAAVAIAAIAKEVHR